MFREVGDVAAVAAAGFFLGRVAAVESVLEPWRSQLVDRLRARRTLPAAKLAELIGCPYCAGTWLLPVAAVLTGRRPTLRVLLPAAGVAFILHDTFHRDDD